MRSFSQFVEVFDSKLAGLALTFFSLMLIILFVIAVSLTGTYIALNSNLTPSPIYKLISDTFIRAFFTSFPEEGTERYISSLSLLLNVVIIVVTLVFAVTPLIGVIKYRSEQRKREFITSHRIYHNGTDDINIMFKHFKDAEEVIIRSGDFSWLGENSEMCAYFQQLAKQKKLHLISYKNEGDVRAGLDNDDLFNLFSSCFVFGHHDRVKCSYVKRRGSNIFLYKYTNYESGEYRHYILELTQKNETNYLLEVLGDLMA